MVKCQIVLPSATTNGPPPFSLLCLIPPPMPFLLSGFINFLHLSCLIIHVVPLLLFLLGSLSQLIPLASVPYVSPSVSFFLPSINLILLPHLLSLPIQYFPPLSAPKRMYVCLHLLLLFFPSTHVSLSLSLPLLGISSALPSPPERVLPLLHVGLTSRGHVDLSYTLAGITITFVR